MKNKILFFIVLAGFTLLLLELPKQYYKAADNKLYFHQGNGYYESTMTSTVKDFDLKVESFFKQNTDFLTRGIGYTKVLSEEEIEVVVDRIVPEVESVVRPYEPSAFKDYVFSAEILSEVTKRCFTAQIFYRKADVQHVWELGYLDLFTVKNNVPYATIIYDTDTYKIIMMTWNMPLEEIEDFRWRSNSYSGPFPKEYYGKKGDVSYSYIDDGLGGDFYPVSMSYHLVDTSTLYSDLKELARNFWYFTFQQKYTLLYE